MKTKDEIWRIVAGSQLAHYAGMNKEWIDDLVEELAAQQEAKHFNISVCCHASARSSIRDYKQIFICDACNKECDLVELCMKFIPKPKQEAEKECPDCYKDYKCVDHREKPKQLPGLPEKLNIPCFVKDYFMRGENSFVGEALQCLNDHIGMLENKTNEILDYLKARER